MYRLVKKTGLILIFILTLIGSEALADKNCQVETLIVTAEKKEADVQKVPVSMNAFDSIDLENAGIDNTPEITRFIPNVYFKEATMENIIVVRGVSSVDGSTIGPVGVYIDDINYPLHFMHNIELLNVERIEMLRGPQGTLYGRNTESGVLNIVTRQPGNEFQGTIKGSLGYYDTSHGNIPEYKASVSFDIPALKQNLFIGLDTNFSISDGFMKNRRFGKEDSASLNRKNLRGSARWIANDRLEFSFIADSSDYDDKQGLYRVFTSKDGLKNDENTENRGFFETQLDQKSSGQVLKAKFKGSKFDLLSITGKRNYEQFSILGSGVGIQNYGKNIWKFNDDFYSQEFRFSSKNNSAPFEWLLGFYGFMEDTDIDFSKFNKFQTRKTKIEKNGGAVFFNGTYTFFNRLHVTAGLRYDCMNLDGNQDLQGHNWGGKDISADYHKDMNFNEWLPKAVISFDVKDNIMIYTSAAKGYLEGGYNYAQATDENNFVFDPEYTWNYEIGIKTSWFNKRVIANASVYYIKMDDKQVSEYTAGGAVAKISNAAKAYSRGVEFELKAKPSRGIDFFATFGYVDAEIDEWEAGSSDNKGNKMPNTPEYSYNVGAQYRHNSGLFTRIDYLGTGEMYGNVQNNSHVKLDNYNILNLRLGYEQENFDIVLWCSNALDKTYYTSAFDYGDPKEAIGIAQNGEPRSYGISFTMRF